MRAKFQVRSVVDQINDYQNPPAKTGEAVEFFAVTEKPFDADGASEDNQFAKWTPSAELKITITNPNLFGTFAQGDKFYADFTKAEA